eukprot:TRINITY_DN5416_c0_g1_i2.p1 TRINITY_DN5416_c0_g1~~TRINITY_DN5416_c0_g1_i2.p1  ORF type:complete len:273 (-),score=31.70 TRINITY_DN5416_c0_g1_i2:145-963(-)
MRFRTKFLILFTLALTISFSFFIFPSKHNFFTKEIDALRYADKPKDPGDMKELSPLQPKTSQILTPDGLLSESSVMGDTNTPTPLFVSGGNLSTSCKKRPNRKNPKTNGQRSCPVVVSFANSSNLNSIAIENVADLKLHSIRNCTSEDHCEYRNICLLPRNERFMWLSPVVDGKMRFPAELRYKIGFYIYKEGEAKRRSLSWNYEFLKDSNYVAPTSVRWLDGTTIWYDQSYNEPCHQGHASEFYSKLVDLRKQFPGKVDRILYNNKQSGHI